jgi:hypothetical protein
MTAELAVLNRTAVALAADSASTSLQSTGLPKIFNTADKLFHLNGVDPIGVMVYGNSQFMGVPWETIIKKYRSAPHQAHASLADAANNFLTFLTSADLFSDAHLARWLEQHITELSRDIFNHITGEAAKRGGGVTRDQVLTEVVGIVNALPLMPGLTDQDVANFIAQWDQQMNTAITAAFTAAPLQNLDDVKRIIARVNLTVPREQDGGVSGIVVAGFGERELFPVLWNCLVRSVMAGRMLQRTQPEVQPLEMPMTAMIRAFAQREMVHSFLWGIDPMLDVTVEGTFANLLQRFADHLAGLTGFVGQQLTDFQAAATATIGSIRQNFRSEINQYCRDKHVDPVLAAIGLLPKDQLAVMAETLVSLTSFKRKMSRDAETVGGDVDVAVISKGDGFVWVKRKHYFPPELNLRYTERIRQSLE